MKITEVISEASSLPGAGSLGKAGTSKSTLRSLGASSLKFRRIFTIISRRRAASASRAAQTVDKMTKRLGPWMMLLRIIGVATACYELWEDLDAAQAAYEAGEIESESELREFRQFYTGVFVASILAPAVAKMLVNSRYVVWVARFIVRVVGLGTSVLTVGASVAALIATEAFFTFLTVWLNSDAAKDWMSNYLLKPLILVGSVPETAWSMLTGYYEKADKKRVEKGQPSGKDTSTPLGYVQPKVPPTLIGGVRVTDAEGYLLPNADLNPAVKAVLMQPNSPEAKKFAAIPKQPSSAADKELGYSNKLNPTKVVDPATGKLVNAA